MTGVTQERPSVFLTGIWVGDTFLGHLYGGHPRATVRVFDWDLGW